MDESDSQRFLRQKTKAHSCLFEAAAKFNCGYEATYVLINKDCRLDLANNVLDDCRAEVERVENYRYTKESCTNYSHRFSCSQFDVRGLGLVLLPGANGCKQDLKPKGKRLRRRTRTEMCFGRMKQYLRPIVTC